MLIEIGLSNIAMAAALAVVAVIVGRAFRRPALTHSLWLLVLIKLITPPLFYVPVAFLTSLAAETAAKEPEALVLAEPEVPPVAKLLPAEALLALPEIIQEDVPPRVLEPLPPEPEPAKAIV